MHPEGLLRICVPKEHGGLGASFRTYCLAAAELGRYCGATALSWNMHVCSTLWTGALADDLEMSAEERAAHNAARGMHYRRIVENGAIYSQPFSEGGAAAAGAAAFGTEAKPVDGGFHRQRQEDLRLALGRRRLLRHPLHRARRGRRGKPPQHALSRRPGECAGRQRRRRLGSARHARHGLAHAADEGRVRAGERAADAARRLLPRRDLVAAHVPHALADLHGSRAGGLRFHRRVSARRSARHAAGEAAHVSRPSRSPSPRCA